MKKLFITMLAALVLVSCGDGNSQKKNDQQKAEQPVEQVAEQTPVDDGFVSIFDGETFTGWRGYNRADMPAAWTIEDGCIKINGSGMGEAGAKDGGDIIFDKKFQNFEFTFEWRVSEGANSGVFYLGQEVENEPLYISAPEYQILDNERHPDAKLGIDGNRMSASLYDMIPAKPQNAKPAGEWNTAKILVYKGTVVHYQNDVAVLEYHLWTPRWTEMLQASKFSETAWPTAFALLNNCGGENHEGYLGLQDHGDTVWYRNLKVKVLE